MISVDHRMWAMMGRPWSPLDIFTAVMKQGHEPKSNRITFDTCKCGEEKFAYSDLCIHCTDKLMKRLWSNPDIKSLIVRRA